MSRFTENPEGNGILPFAIHSQEPLDLYYHPIEEIEIGSGRTAVHPEVIATMPDTEHVTTTDFNLAAFAALGVTSEQLGEIMPNVRGTIDRRVSGISALLGNPVRNGLAQEFYAHKIFETTQKGSFPDLQASEQTFLEWLATGKTIGQSAKATSITEYRANYIIKKLRGEKNTTPLAELLVTAHVAGKIAITRFYQKPDTV